MRQKGSCACLISLPAVPTVPRFPAPPASAACLRLTARRARCTVRTCACCPSSSWTTRRCEGGGAQRADLRRRRPRVQGWDCSRRGGATSPASFGRGDSQHRAWWKPRCSPFLPSPKPPPPPYPTPIPPTHRPAPPTTQVLRRGPLPLLRAVREGRPGVRGGAPMNADEQQAWRGGAAGHAESAG